MTGLTNDQKFIGGEVTRFWPWMRVEYEVPLRSLLPEPAEKEGALRHIWKYGTCDIVVSGKHGPIAVFEPGGGQHIHNKRQVVNDRLKWAVLLKNNIRCGHFINGLFDKHSNRTIRKWLGRYLFATRRDETRRDATGQDYTRRDWTRLDQTCPDAIQWETAV